MGDELKPCPFCGGNSIKVDQWATWYCRCENCGSEQISTTKEGAITAWNTRAQGPGPGEAVSQPTGAWSWQTHEGHGWIRAERDGKAYNAADDVSEEDGLLICEAVNRMIAATPTREG